MTPDLLAAYLAVLPPNAFQVEMSIGDLHIKLNMQPAASADEGERVPEKDDPPAELVEFFPQLADRAA